MVIEGIEVEIGQDWLVRLPIGRPLGRSRGVSRVSPGKASMAGPPLAPLARITASSQRVPGQAIRRSSWAISVR